jgi:hypothetical protein
MPSNAPSGGPVLARHALDRPDVPVVGKSWLRDTKGETPSFSDAHSSPTRTSKLRLPSRSRERFGPLAIDSRRFVHSFGGRECEI